MTKTEFLEYLEKKLHVLNQKEREDILSEYAQHIEFKMESGLSEEDAIHDFGNLEELAAEILDAYNVNPDYDKKTIHIDGRQIGKSMARAGQKVGGIFNRGSRSVKRILDKSSRGRIDLLLRCCLIAAVLFTAYLPLAGLAFWVGNVFYSIFGSPLDYMLCAAVIVGFHLFYLLLSISVLHAYLVKYRQGAGTEKGDRGEDEEEIFMEDGEELFQEDREEGEEDGEPYGDKHGDGVRPKSRPGIRDQKVGRRFGKAARRLRNLFILPGFSGEETVLRPRRQHHFFRNIWNLILACAAFAVKGVVLCCIAPIFLFLAFMVVMFGTLIVLVVMGYPLIGAAVMTLGGLISGFAFIWFIWDILFSKKAGKQE